MAQQSESRNLDKIVVRVPDGMRDRIARAAKENGRSTNAEIVSVLEMHYPPEPAADEMAQLIEGVLKLSNGNPAKEQWNNLYQLLDEFKARLLRDVLTKRYGADAGAEFDRRRLE